ncbi:MAG: hypothetical protein J6M03_01185 [Clostridia bacterium]|nr:hypothetical protein [Clostridia bacterium]
MAAEYDIISKNVYRYAQTDDFVRVSQYSFLRKDGRRYLALRFENRLGTKITGMSFTLLQKNSTGEVLERTPVSYPELEVESGAEFSHSSMIRVRPDCTDFEIIWDEVRSGELIYTVSGGRAVARYDRIDPALDNIDSAEASRVPPTPKRHKHLMRFFALIAVIAIIVGNIFYLIGAISEENERRREHSSGTMNQGFYLK